MTDSSTVGIGFSLHQAESSATGHWQQNSARRVERDFRSPRIGKIRSMLFALACSPATAVQDIWFQEQKRRDSVMTVQFYQRVIGRPISRFETLLISRRILETAESERLAQVKLEAKMGIQWGDEK